MDTRHLWRRRIIAVANQKGGVLKTSIVVNLALLLTWLGFKVLIVDWDPQGNVGLDLGYKDAGLSDGGRNLTDAVMHGDALKPLKNIRPNLDVVPGGPTSTRIVPHLAAEIGVKGLKAKGALGRALAPLAPSYDFILIDCPPGDTILQDEALEAAKWLMLVTKTDRASREGLGTMTGDGGLTDRIEDALVLNPELRILSAVVTGVGSRSTAIMARAHEYLVQLLGDAAPVSTAIVRHLESAAETTREIGQTAVEISSLPRDLTTFLNDVAEGKSAEFVPASSVDYLAMDYLEITLDVVDQIQVAETELENQLAGGK